MTKTTDDSILRRYWSGYPDLGWLVNGIVTQCFGCHRHQNNSFKNAVCVMCFCEHQSKGKYLTLNAPSHCINCREAHPAIYYGHSLYLQDQQSVTKPASYTTTANICSYYHLTCCCSGIEIELCGTFNIESTASAPAPTETAKIFSSISLVEIELIPSNGKELEPIHQQPRTLQLAHSTSGVFKDSSVHHAQKPTALVSDNQSKSRRLSGPVGLTASNTLRIVSGLFRTENFCSGSPVSFGKYLSIGPKKNLPQKDILPGLNKHSPGCPRCSDDPKYCLSVEGTFLSELSIDRCPILVVTQHFIVRDKLRIATLRLGPLMLVTRSCVPLNNRPSG